MTITAHVRGKHLRQSEAGGLERWCTGHEEWLPVREFNRRVPLQDSKPKAWHWFHLCKTCRAARYDRTIHGDISGLVPLLSVWWIFDEIAQRVGMMKAAGLCGISYDNLRRILYRRSFAVQRRNVRTAIHALRELRVQAVVAAPKTGRPMAYGRDYRRELHG